MEQYLLLVSIFNIAELFKGVLIYFGPFNSRVFQKILSMKHFFEIAIPNLLLPEIESDVLIKVQHQCY